MLGYARAVRSAPSPVRAPFGLRWRYWLLVTVVLWAAAAAFTVFGAYRAATKGEAAIGSARSMVEVENLSKGDLVRLGAEFEVGASEFGRAHSLLQSRLLEPLRPIPVIGRQLAAGRALLGDTDAVASRTSEALDRSLAIAEGGAETNSAAQLGSLVEALESLRAVLAEPGDGPKAGLVSPLADAKERFDAQRAELLGWVDPIATFARGLHSLYRSGTYLVLASNPAEMRLAGGMPLSAGELNFNNGEAQLTAMQNTGQLFPVSGVPILDLDVAANWGFLSPSNDYRKLGYSARFEEWAGPQALAMWERQHGTDLDGVIQLDPFVVEALLRVVGPVEAEGRVHTADGILAYLLVGQYEEFGDQDFDLQDRRRDQLSLIAGAVVARLAEGGWDPLELARVMRPLVRGRHILAYSEQADQQSAWKAAGVSGTLEGNEVGVFLLNLTASKIDPYVEVAVNVSVETQSAPIANSRRVQLSITVSNRVPDTISNQAAGLWQEIGLDARGTYLGRLVVYAPAFASALRFEPERALEVYGPDGQVIVMGSRVEIAPGETSTFVATFEIPETAIDLEVVPSTRFPPQTWTFEGNTWLDSERFELPLNG